MKPRRETGSTHSCAADGNSRCTASSNSGVPASSSIDRQYFLPFTPLNFSRTAASVIGASAAGSLVAVEQVHPDPQPRFNPAETASTPFASGLDFSRAETGAKSSGALAPEAC